MKDLDAECNFSALPREEIELAGMYEYWRESQPLREALRNRRLQMPPSFASDLSFGSVVLLWAELRKAGFPKPWNSLKKSARRRLLGWHQETKQDQRAIVIEDITPYLDADGKSGEPIWLLDPLALRRGFISVRGTCSEKKFIAAATAWFRDDPWRSKTRGGNPRSRESWQARLNDLVVMRLKNRFPKDPNKRVEHIVKFTIPGSKGEGFKGCKDYWKERQRQIHEGRGVEPMSKTPEGNKANVEMSQARRNARSFFQTLFPGEEPLNY